MSSSNPTPNTTAEEEYPQIKQLKLEDEKTEKDDSSDKASVASEGSDDSVMEPFEDYKSKIEQLLDSIGLKDFFIEPIQHGYGFMNCVYSLTPSKDFGESYILRVAIDGFIRASDGRHETMENDIAVMAYLKDKLPVPLIKAYSTTADNVLEAAYTVQTMVPGEPLSKLWARMHYEDKYAIVDEFLKLLVKVESITFETAGELVTSTVLPASLRDFADVEDPVVHVFKGSSQEPIKDPKTLEDRAGPDVKLLFTSLLEDWNQDEFNRGVHDLSCAITLRFKKLLAMLEDMQAERHLKDQPFPIVLHHWDLEPRNLMVARVRGAWKICGVIDWDDAVTMPRPLARVPPRWIWHFPDEDPDPLEDHYLNDDQYKDPELSDESKAIKAYFDEKVEALLPGYTEDAYGRGRWLRRIWHWCQEGAFRTWQWEFLDQLPEDWAARGKSAASSPTC